MGQRERPSNLATHRVGGTRSVPSKGRDSDLGLRGLWREGMQNWRGHRALSDVNGGKLLVGGASDGHARKARGAIDIMFKMVDVCGKGAKRTEIMYKANLSHAMLKRYMKTLVDARLIHNSTADETYKPTNKGFSFARDYEELTRAMKLAQTKKTSLLRSLDTR